MEITRISIWFILMLFFIYFIIHIILGVNLKNKKEEIKEKPGNLEITKQHKLYKHLFKWFPFYYAIFVLIIFYIQ